jgi:hypothetical protein
VAEGESRSSQAQPGANALLALLASPSDADSAVNNLSELGISERHISVITATLADARAIIGDGGPLQGVTAETLQQALQSRGLDAAEAQRYSQGVAAGHALVAVASPPGSQDAVRTTLQDYNPIQSGMLPEVVR